MGFLIRAILTTIVIGAVKKALANKPRKDEPADPRRSKRT